MSLREHMYDRANVILLAGPLSDSVIGGLDRAVEEQVRSADGGELRRKAPSGGRGAWSRPGRRELDDLSARVVVRHEPGVALAELAVRANETGYSGLPLAIHVSGSNVAFMLPHDLFDGVGGWRQINAVVSRAAGVQIARSPGAALRFPVAATLRRQGLLAPARVKAVQRIRKAAEAVSATEPQFPGGVAVDRTRRLSALSYLRFDRADLARWKAADPDPAEPRSAIRLTALVVEALRDAASSACDFPIRMMVDVRRYAPHGARFAGPFASDVPLGTLRTGDNSAAALGARLDGSIDAKVPLTGLALDLTYLFKRRLRHPFRPPERRTLIHRMPVMLSVLPSRLPEKAWASDEQRVCAGLGMHPDYVANPYVQVCRMKDGMHVTLWDEVGCFDRNAYEAALSARILGRVSEAATTAQAEPRATERPVQTALAEAASAEATLAEAAPTEILITG